MALDIASHFVHVAPRFSPDVRLDRIPVRNGYIYAVRDDLLPGGTKQRAAIPYLKGLVRDGYKSFAYASPFAGFAQVALASACRDLNLRCLIFAERDPNQGGFKKHAFTELAEKFGATVTLSPSLSESEEQAAEFEGTNTFSKKIPLGFNSKIFRDALEREIRKQWSIIERKAQPETVWLPLGSGTLASVFAKVLPQTIEIRCVDVHVLPPTDERIQALRVQNRIRIESANELFCEPATFLPPIASNLHYDAKLWTPIFNTANDGDLWWNVAR